MAETDGILRVSYEVHCRTCERPALGLGDTVAKATRALRSDGWFVSRGRWHCADHARPHDTPKAGRE